jgi:hypothetical protein
VFLLLWQLSEMQLAIHTPDGSVYSCIGAEGAKFKGVPSLCERGG